MGYIIVLNRLEMASSGIVEMLYLIDILCYTEIVNNWGTGDDNCCLGQ